MNQPKVEKQGKHWILKRAREVDSSRRVSLTAKEMEAIAKKWLEENNG